MAIVEDIRKWETELKKVEQQMKVSVWIDASIGKGKFREVYKFRVYFRNGYFEVWDYSDPMNIMKYDEKFSLDDVIDLACCSKYGLDWKEDLKWSHTEPVDTQDYDVYGNL